jgi:hypothetical protein
MNVHYPENRLFDSTDDSVVESRLHLRTLGPKYPPHNSNAPLFEGLDFAGLMAVAVITLGPLAAYSFGMGAYSVAL